MFGPDSRLGARVRHLARRSLRFVGGLSERDLEYSFALRTIRQLGPVQATILDVGSVGSLLPLQLARSGHSVMVCDARRYPEHHPNLSVIQGDFLSHPFAERFYDVVTMISTIEHIGFGHYGDPHTNDADMFASRIVQRVLKRGGKLVLTIPYAHPAHVVPGFERWYDEPRLARLLDGLDVMTREFWLPSVRLFGRWARWKPCDAQAARSALADHGYHATLCLLAVKR